MRMLIAFTTAIVSWRPPPLVPTFISIMPTCRSARRSRPRRTDLTIWFTQALEPAFSTVAVTDAWRRSRR